MLGGELQLWRAEGERVRALSEEKGAWWPELEGTIGHSIDTPDGPAWLEPIPGNHKTWLQLGPDRTSEDGRPTRAATAAAVIGEVLSGEREAALVAAELAIRYEEINLLYTISDILGRTVRLDKAAQTIVREVSDVVGARRASIMVYDGEAQVLRVVAGRGLEPSGQAPVSIHDDCSIAAKVFREQKALGHDAASGEPPSGCDPTRPYKGESFLSVPILYGSGGEPRPVGVINLTDRLGEDTFTAGHKKLVAAIASQIGAAIENARLVETEREQMRLATELALAHNLQAALMPAPALLASLGDIGARSSPLESVGGDFYNVITPRKEAMGVMIGDVSSHGLPAALLMAHAISAAGVLAQYTHSPEQALQRLLEQIGAELGRTEMYMSIFYGVVDRRRGSLRYANAGHPYAFLVPGDGREPRRLAATAPPLGLSSEKIVLGGEVEWKPKSDILCLFTDGIPESRDAEGKAYGEARLLDVVKRHHGSPAPEIVEQVFADVEAFSQAEAADDRTVLMLRR